MVNDGKSWEIHHAWMLLGWNLWNLELFHQGVCNSWTTLFPPMQWRRVPYTMRFRRGSVRRCWIRNIWKICLLLTATPEVALDMAHSDRKVYIDIIMCELILNLCWFDFRCVYNTCVYNTYIYWIHMFFLVCRRYFRFVGFLPVFAQWTFGKVAFNQAFLCDGWPFVCRFAREDKLWMKFWHDHWTLERMFLWPVWTNVRTNAHMHPCLIEIVFLFRIASTHCFRIDFPIVWKWMSHAIRSKLPIRYCQWGGFYKVITKQPRHY